MPLSERLARFPRTRSAFRVVQVVVVVLALSIGGTGAFLVSQSSRATEVTADDVLADFRETASADAEGLAQPTQAPSGEAQHGVATQPSQGADPATTSGDPSPAPTQAAASPPAPTPVDDPTTPQPRATADPQQPPAAPTFGKPQEGVYTYDTSGYETVSMAGGRHDYPEQTYSSVRHTDGCGWETDHRFLEEHREVKRWCSDGPQLGATGFSSYITFFGQQTESHGSCDPPQIAARLDASPGQSFDSSCSGDGWTSTSVTTFVARETLVVGGVEVQALHFNQVTTLRGNQDGRSDMEAWYHPETGLPLKVIRDTTTRTQAFGGQVEYNEEVTLVLTSLSPRR